MSIKRILAAASASVVAVSAMAVVASAVDIADYFTGNNEGCTLYIATDDGSANLVADTDLDITTIYGARAHVTFDAADVADEAVWLGGGIGTNSPTNSWRQVEWGRSGKEITPDFENNTITWLDTEPLFTTEDAYAHIWLQDWGTKKASYDSIELLDKDGNVISVGGDAAPAEESKPEESTPEESKPEESKADENTGAAANNVDPGVEGVAAVIGVAAVAAGALVVAKKRK